MLRKLWHICFIARELVLCGVFLIAAGCIATWLRISHDPHALGWLPVGALFYGGASLVVVAFVAVRDSERRLKIFNDAMETERDEP